MVTLTPAELSAVIAEAYRVINGAPERHLSVQGQYITACHAIVKMDEARREKVMRLGPSEATVLRGIGTKED